MKTSFRSYSIAKLLSVPFSSGHELKPVEETADVSAWDLLEILKRFGCGLGESEGQGFKYDLKRF